MPNPLKNLGMASISRIKAKLTLHWRSLTHHQRLWTIFVCAVALFALLVALDSRLTDSDDMVFITQTAPYHTVVDWVSARYQNWSGRVAGEGIVYIFSNLPLILWQITTVGMYALFSGLLFRYYRIITSPKSYAKTDIIALIAALTLPYLLDKSVFAEGILWVTGGMVYFWSVTLMLLALYAPTAYVLRHKLPSWWLIIASYLATIVVTLSQEQAGISLIVALLCLVIAAFRQRLTLRWHHLSLSAVAVVSFVISIKAPGNIVRLRAETATWLPDFYTTPLGGHINDAFRWTLEALVNHSGLMIVLLWVSISALLFIRKKRALIDYVLIAFFVSMGVLSIGRGLEVLQYWTVFHATWHAETPSLGASIILVPWVIALIATPLAVIRAVPDLTARLIVITLIICGYGTTLMMTLTPTMYASSWRSMLVPSMILGLAALITTLQLWRRSRRELRLMLYVVLVYSLSQYALQLSRMVAQK